MDLLPVLATSIPKAANLYVAITTPNRLSFTSYLLGTLGWNIQIICALRRGEVVHGVSPALLTCITDMIILARLATGNPMRWRLLGLAINLTITVRVFGWRKLTHSNLSMLSLTGVALVLASKVLQLRQNQQQQRREKAFVFSLFALLQPVKDICTTLYDVTDRIVLYLFTASLALEIALIAQCIYFS